MEQVYRKLPTNKSITDVAPPASLEIKLPSLCPIPVSVCVGDKSRKGIRMLKRTHKMRCNCDLK